MITFDSNITYLAPNQVLSGAHIRVYSNSFTKKKLVVITEIHYGMSITNAIETITWELIKSSIASADDIFIEHYPGDRKYPETYDLVTYVKWLAFKPEGPTWLRISNENWASLVKLYTLDHVDQEDQFYKELIDEA